MPDQYQLRFAERNDEEQIVQFLHEHWRQNHIFCSAPELLRWQHMDPDDPEKLTFVLAMRGPTEDAAEIIGILGFMPFRRFDRSLDPRELSLAIWKVRDKAGPPGLGIQLIKAVEREYQPVIVAAIGISEMVNAIYPLLGYQLGRLSQAALFGLQAPEGSVAVGVQDWMRKPIADAKTSCLITVGASELDRWRERIDELGQAVLPTKSATYLQQRFLQHLCYDYDLQGIQIDGVLQAIMVIRRVAVPDCGSSAAILRVVDFIGNDSALGHVGGSLQELVDQTGCDYMDIMHYGIDPESLQQAGFIDRDSAPDLILPNYFEPFVSENIDIDLAFRVNKELSDRPVRLMRADSDQDRPNSGPIVVRESHS